MPLFCIPRHRQVIKIPRQVAGFVSLLQIPRRCRGFSNHEPFWYCRLHSVETTGSR